MELLPTVWFIAIAVLWIGYLVLDGFDLGVGMHMLVSTRDERDRRVMLNTIGPVWDGNEVWLITAGAGTFAAFPLWYASLFSALYLPLVFVLLGLILRAVSIEWRGKLVGHRWAATWTWAIGVGSFLAAFGIGAALALTTIGLPIDANGDRVGGPFAFLTPAAVIGGLGVVGFCFVHAAVFLALKSDGRVRALGRHVMARWSPVLLLPIVLWVLWVQLASGDPLSWTLVVLAVAAIVAGWIANRRGREGWAFTGVAVFLIAGAAAIFAAVYPVVLPSTIDPAFSLTAESAASGDYTLGVMSVVALFGLPIVLAYEAWTYWVFRRRVSPDHIREAHAFPPAVRAESR